METVRFPSVRRLTVLAAALWLGATAVGACVRPIRMPAPGELDPDKYLYDRGTEALQRRRWLEAREYFQRLIDQYPQSTYRQEARLGVGDSYLGEDAYDSLIIAAEKFREFLRFFPLNERADYAQYRVAVAESEQMLAPERDQTSTINTLREIEAFVQRYPDSKYMPEAMKLRRVARDRLSDSELRVAQYYYRSRWDRGVIPRLERLMTSDPEYPRRDAAYYLLGESLYRSGRQKDALPLFTRLVEEFKESEYLEGSRLRIAELTR